MEWATETLEGMNYRALQKLAKTRGIPANKSRVELISRLGSCPSDGEATLVLGEQHASEDESGPATMVADNVPAAVVEPPPTAATVTAALEKLSLATPVLGEVDAEPLSRKALSSLKCNELRTSTKSIGTPGKGSATTVIDKCEDSDATPGLKPSWSLELAAFAVEDGVHQHAEKEQAPTTSDNDTTINTNNTGQEPHRDAEDERLNQLVEGSPHLQYMADRSRVLCTLTGQEIVPRYLDVLAYLGSKRVRYLLANGPFSFEDYTSRGIVIMQDPDHDSFVHCELTGVRLYKTKAAVDKHINGRRFQEVQAERDLGAKENASHPQVQLHTVLEEMRRLDTTITRLAQH